MFAHDEAQVGSSPSDGAAGGQRQVVATERVLREVADHRARLHAEQRGREHPHHVAHAGQAGHPAACPGKPRRRRARSSASGRRRRPAASPRRAWWPAPRARAGARRGGGRPSPAAPTVASVVANVAVRPVSPTTSVCAACASSSNCLRSAGDDRRLGPALERDPLGGLARDLPVDGSGRLQHPHHLAEVDLREVERGRVEVAAGPPPNRKARKAAASGDVRRAPRGLRVERCRPRGQCMGVHSVAVTGASGLVGRHLLPVLAAHPDVDRGPRPRRARARIGGRRNVEFARVDIAGTELKPLLEGIDVVVHLAGVVDPMPDVGADGAGQRRGHPARARRRRVGRRDGGSCASRAPPSTARGPNNPVPLTEDAAAPPEPALLARGAGRRGRAPPRRVARRATPTSPSPRCARRRWSARARSACPPASCSGRPPLRVRGAAMPVQVVHVDDLAAALALAATHDLPGVYNVAADGWLDAAAARALHPAFGGARAPGRGARALAATAPGSSGIGDVPPGVVPYLVHPWVIANDKLKAAGWAPRAHQRGRDQRGAWRRCRRARSPSRSS